jgi:hypothetical protein
VEEDMEDMEEKREGGAAGYLSTPVLDLSREVQLFPGVECDDPGYGVVEVDDDAWSLDAAVSFGSAVAAECRARETAQQDRFGDRECSVEC